MGNMSRRQQPDQRADNSEGSSTQLKIPAKTAYFKKRSVDIFWTILQDHKIDIWNYH